MKCPACSDEFEPAHHKQTFCKSPRCQRDRRQEQTVKQYTKGNLRKRRSEPSAYRAGKR